MPSPIVAIVFVGYYDILVAATSVGLDSHAYWAAWTHPLYSIPPGHVDAFLYSPVVAEVMWPLGHLPADLFIGLWAAAMLAVFAWLLRPAAARCGTWSACCCACPRPWRATSTPCWR